MTEIPSRAIGEVTLVGEVVDPKCWLGDMKPGDGKAHAACARLCMEGGIPPMLRVRTDSSLSPVEETLDTDHEEVILLVTESGAAR